MFSVNVDKLTGMTESEHHSYSDTVDAIIKECDKNYRIIATHGEPLMAFKLASVIHEKVKKLSLLMPMFQKKYFLQNISLERILKDLQIIFRRMKQSMTLYARQTERTLILYLLVKLRSLTRQIFWTVSFQISGIVLLSSMIM